MTTDTSPSPFRVLFQATIARDGIHIPVRMQAEVAVELALLEQHLAIVNAAVSEGSEPSNVYRLSPVEQS